MYIKDLQVLLLLLAMIFFQHLNPT